MYFHIQTAPHHRPSLRLVFKGEAYQYTVLLFRLSLAPHTFMKCASLSPLRQKGVRILNYFNDWLVLAQLRLEMCTQVPAPQPFRMSGVQDQTGQEFAVSQPTNFFSDADLAFARVLSENSEARGIIQSWTFSSPQNVPKTAGPHGSSLLRRSSRSASYVAISILAKSLRPSLCMMNWMPQSQGDPQLRQHPGSLEITPSVPVGCGSGLSLQNKGSCDRRLQHSHLPLDNIP